jgi:hypothetical protein
MVRSESRDEEIRRVKAKLKACDDHCKVVWIYCGHTENVPAMYDKPRRLCNWWKREHKRDAQYCRGVLKVVTMYKDIKTS